MFILLIYSYNQRTIKEVKELNFISDVSRIVNAIDRRVFIEGLEHTNWDTFEWTSSTFDDFLRKDLISRDNEQCGLDDGWSPKYNSDITTSTSNELGDYATIVDKTMRAKLIPCNFWKNYPLKELKPSLKIANEDDFVKTFTLNLSFDSDEKWSESLMSIRKLTNAISKRYLDTTMLNTTFKYIVGGVSVSQQVCSINKSACSYNIIMDTSKGDSASKRLMINSSNSMETDIKFSLDAVNTDAISCEAWRVNKDTNIWSKVTIDCGLLGGSNGSEQFLAIGSDLDTDSVKLNINRDCKKYTDNGVKNQKLDEDLSACGIFDNGDIEMSANTVNTKTEIVKTLNSNKINTENTNIKTNLITDQTDVLGNKETVEEAKIFKPETEYIFSKDRVLNSVKVAGSAIDVSGEINFEEQLYVGNDILLGENSKVDSESINIRQAAVFNQLTTDGTPTRANVTVQNESLPVNIYQTESLNVSGSVFPNAINNKVFIEGGLNVENLINTDVLVSTGLTDIDNLEIVNKLETEQLHFNESMKLDSSLNIGKSISLDGTGSQYTFAPINGGNDYIVSGWGSDGTGSSMGGLSAKEIGVNGDVILDIKTTSDFGSGLRGFSITPKRNNVNDITPLLNASNSGALHIFNRSKKTDGGFQTNPIIIGDIFIGDASALRRDNPNFSTGKLNSVKNRVKAEIFTAAVDENLQNGYVAGQNISDRADRVVSVNNMAIVTPNKGVILYDGVFLRGVNKRPITPEGNAKNVIALSDVGQIHKDFWIIKNGSHLGLLHTASVDNLGIFDDIYRAYVDVSKFEFPAGVDGDKGIKGDTGEDSDRGDRGEKGPDGRVGIRGKNSN